jgi:hypothetical protein
LNFKFEGKNKIYHSNTLAKCCYVGCRFAKCLGALELASEAATISKLCADPVVTLRCCKSSFPGANIIKLFTAVSYKFPLEC